MRIAICDDDSFFRSQIRRCLLQYDSGLELTEFSSGTALCESDAEFDVIFLDFEMPDLNGMDTARRLRSAGRTDYIIFLTAHTEMIFEAFYVRAFRFLQKPLQLPEMAEALRAVQAEIAENSVLMVSVGGSILRLHSREILYLEAYGDGVFIYHVQGDVYDVHEPLKAVAERLSAAEFFRIHKSYLVSLRYVQAVRGGNVLMDDQTELPLARRNTAAFKSAYLDYVRAHAGGI